MMQTSTKTDARKPRTRMFGRRCAAFAVLGPLLLAGCDDAVRDEFRGAALSQVESGVKAIFDGILTGIFTIAEPSPGEDNEPAAAS
jgi:hypothetical protein